jgi:hypothetical protein
MTGRPEHIQLRLAGTDEIKINLTGVGFGTGWKRVDSAEMREHLKVFAGAPTTYLVVDVSPEASCARVRALSEDLEQLPMCREGWCLTRSAWGNYKGE